jgi:Putative NADP-dependent oxidoreductases
VRRALREQTPDGVDVYFDNVGGEILDDVLTRLARGARVVICGAISQYNETQVRGPANYLMLLVARASMTGMLVFDYATGTRRPWPSWPGGSRTGSSSRASTSCTAGWTPSPRRC